MFGCSCQPVQKRRVQWCWAAQLCPDAAAAAVGSMLRFANAEALRALAPLRHCKRRARWY